MEENLLRSWHSWPYPDRIGRLDTGQDQHCLADDLGPDRLPVCLPTTLPDLRPLSLLWAAMLVRTGGSGHLHVQEAGGQVDGAGTVAGRGIGINYLRDPSGPCR